MIFDALSELNWLAVVVATIAWFAFSAVWYSVPPLSSAWQKAARVESTEDGPPMWMLFVPNLIGYFITAVVIALIVESTGTTSVADGISLGIALGVGFGVVSAFISQLYEQKGATYWLINGVNAVIAYSIVAVILAVWD